MPFSRTETDLKQSPFYEYHHATKHTIQKLYSYGHRLDWASQPDPFLRFAGAPIVDLPHEFFVSSDDLFQAAVSHVENARRGFINQDSDAEKSETDDLLKFISNLLFYGVAISAWKQVVGTNNRWALRVNASSGNLHPTDTHVLISRDSGVLGAGAYHYKVSEHKLEQRVRGDAVTPLIRRLGIQSEAPPVVLCLSSIFFREAWKYRERAFRYCQHDMGHALASLSLSASALGGSMRIVGIFPDEEVADYLGLNQADEKPLALVLLSPGSTYLFDPHDSVLSLDSFDAGAVHLGEPGGTKTATLSAPGPFIGKPNQLSSQIIDYPQISRVYQATKYDLDSCRDVRRNQKDFFTGVSAKSAPKPGPIQAAGDVIDLQFDFENASRSCQHKSVHQTIRKRRSAVDMDGRTGMSLEHLTYILRTSTMGFPADFQGVDVLTDGHWSRSAREHLVHLYLYVHRVDGLTPGLYYFDRFENTLVPLLLRDQREGAKETSCFQDIACDGAFSVSMIADFQEGYRLYGDRCYRFAHYEAGYIGQMLYLTACALGHDATGIGCFVDDDINKYLALDDGKEVIYNFTFGKAVHDSRLTTLPSYAFSTPDF